MGSYGASIVALGSSSMVRNPLVYGDAYLNLYFVIVKCSMMDLLLIGRQWSLALALLACRGLQ